MGFIESIATTILARTANTPAGQHGFLSSICDLINSPQTGGLQGLVEKFKASGLSQIADGWVAKGPNPPVTTEQLRNVISADQLRAFAQKLGMDTNEATNHLADMLPHVVDTLTPEGKLPDGQLDCDAALAMLKQKLFGQ